MGELGSPVAGTSSWRGNTLSQPQGAKTHGVKCRSLDVFFSCGKCREHKMHHLSHVKCVLRGFNYIHTAVQPSPPSTSGNFSSSQTETLTPANTNSPPPPGLTPPFTL